MRRILVLLGFYVNVVLLPAQNIIPDTSEVAYRIYSEEAIDFYKSKKEYNYDLDPKYEQNPIKRLWYSFWRKMLQRMGRDKVNITLEIIKYAVIAIGLFIFGSFLFRSSKTSVFKRGDRSPDFKGALIKSESGDVDIDKLISEAESTERYSEAISYRFLKVLRILDRSGMIEWRDFKTNHDYETELEKSGLAPDFKEISDVFEYVVYGEFDVNSTRYREVSVQFEEFLNRIKTVRA